MSDINEVIEPTLLRYFLGVKEPKKKREREKEKEREREKLQQRIIYRYKIL